MKVRQFSGRKGAAAIGVALSTAIAIGTFAFVTKANAKTVIATATLKTASGETVGTITFENPKDGDATIVKADFAFASGSVEPGTYHGMHIHANDTPSNGNGCLADAKNASNTWFTSTDGHMKNAADEVHGNHAGDLPSVYINRDRTAHLEARIDRVQASQLFDRAVIFHANPDNFNNIPKSAAANQYSANSIDAVVLSNNTGNAGDRLACGVLDVK